MYMEVMQPKTILYCLFFSSGPLFADLPLKTMTLIDAEQIALEYNKQLLIAHEDTEQARQRKLQSISRWLPAIGYHAEVERIHPQELFFSIFDPLMPYNLGNTGYSSIFQLNQPLFSTDLFFNFMSKDLEAKVYQYEQANTVNALLLAVRDSYYAVIFYQNGLDIARENIDYLSYALQQEQGRLESGSATPFEVNQSKASVANAIALYYATLKDLKNARNSLILNLGIDPLLEPQMHLVQNQDPLESIPEISIKIQDLDEKYHFRSDTFPTFLDFSRHIERLENARELTLFSEFEVETYLELALSLRPDLLAKQLEIGVAKQNLRAKQGNYLPVVSGYARYSYNDIYLGTTPFFQEDYNWALGIKLSWNLFDSFLREHEISEAKSLQTSTKIQYDQGYQKVEVEIRNGLYQMEEALLAYLSATQAVFVAEQARDQAQDKLKFGRIAPLEYRDSVNQLCQARNQQNRSRFDLLAAYYQVRYSTGLDANY